MIKITQSMVTIPKTEYDELKEAKAKVKEMEKEIQKLKDKISSYSWEREYHTNKFMR